MAVKDHDAEPIPSRFVIVSNLRLGGRLILIDSRIEDFDGNRLFN